ncbi:MAG: primosomal protein, partial [Proteobacteria bacterium]|nr:primosomal protein [Pseudomonadota bacterium]
MALRLNLLVEKPIQEEFEYIYEEQNRNTPASLYIKGPYMMAEGVNKNNRLYPIEEMAKEVSRYSEEMIKNKRAMGELNHPTSADVDLERACHMVTELHQDGNVFYGKSKVLSTPCGQIVRCLVNDGVKVGMSSRALGTLEEGSNFSKV